MEALGDLIGGFAWLAVPLLAIADVLAGYLLWVARLCS